MQYIKQKFQHVAYLDGKEIFRSDQPLAQTTIQEICREYNARFSSENSEGFALEHKLEIIYPFRSDLSKK